METNSLGLILAQVLLLFEAISTHPDVMLINNEQ